ncbi:hypothetical protein HD806DRAFT_501872 [Xylariaceae sp. AK1471]|nr:hypothetical protein HD806DRAFT_501872 [Xylariaceae sp. AK1471]
MGLARDFQYLGGQYEERQLDLALDVAASIMLAVHVTHDPDSIEPGRSKIQWEDAETLDAFIHKAFPEVEVGSDEPITPIKPSKLRAMYFESHADIQVQWTEHLYDHLQLSTSENSKTLKVFQLPCLLEAALEVLKLSEHTEFAQPSSKGRCSSSSSVTSHRDSEGTNNRLVPVVSADETKITGYLESIQKAMSTHENADRKSDNADGSKAPQVEHDTSEKMTRLDHEISDQDSLKLVCYSREFLLETMMTLQLLFPAHDRKTLKGKPIRKPRWLPSWLQFLLNREKLDSRLSSAFVAEGHYQRPLTNRRELYERYPHWALRLHMLLEEVEDPTPLSWAGRWSERRKAARHSFWVTFIAFLIAIVFGITATALGGVQVWISYCQWQGEEGGGSICKLHPPANMNGTEQVTNSTHM